MAATPKRALRRHGLLSAHDADALARVDLLPRDRQACNPLVAWDVGGRRFRPGLNRRLNCESSYSISLMAVWAARMSVEGKIASSTHVHGWATHWKT